MPLSNPAIASISAGATLATGPQVVLSSANGVSFGIAGNTITASVATSLTNINVSASGSSANLSAIVFSNSNNVTFGLTGSTVTASAGGGGGGAATISQWPVGVPALYGFSQAAPIFTGSSGATGGSTQWTASGGVWSVPFPYQLELSRVDGFLSAQATSAGTGSATVGLMFGIYSLNGGTALSRLSSFQFVMEMSQSSLTARTHRWYWGTNSNANSTQISGNVSASFTGLRGVLLNHSALTLSASNYYFGHMATMRSSSANVFGIGSLGYASGSQTTGASYLGESTITAPFGFGGIFSTTTNTNVITGLQMPASIHTSAVTGSGGSSQWRLLYTPMYRNS
jgi:hypothetical protein